MRRFARRRRSAGSGGGRPAPIQAAHWMQRIAEDPIVPVARLDPTDAEEVPADYAAIGVGEAEGGDPIVVAFAPSSGGAAVLAALAVAGRLVEEEGFGGEVVAIAPHWSAAAQRRVGLVGEVPYRFRAVAAPSLSEGAEDVLPEPFAGPPALAVSSIAAQLARPADRELFSRAAVALEGLASKHGGAVRGVGCSVELVLLARRVAELQADDTGVFLNTILPQRSSVRLSADELASALDALEGQLRKRLNDRRVREGEEGLRAAAIPLFRAWHSLRALVPWPLGGKDREVLDLVGVDVAGRAVLGAARKELTLEALDAILDAALVLHPALPVVLSHAAAPVRLEFPRLMLAGEVVAAGVKRALSALSLTHELFQLSRRPEGTLELAVLDAREVAKPGGRPTSAGVESTEQGADSAGEGKTAVAERRSRPRRRGRRGRGGRGSASGIAPEQDAGEAAEAGEGFAGGRQGEGEVAAPLFEEISLFDLDSEEEVAVGRRRRGRSRRRGRRISGEGGAADSVSQTAEQEGGEARTGDSRRRRRSARSTPVDEDERDVQFDDSADEIDGRLADIPDDVSEFDDMVEAEPQDRFTDSGRTDAEPTSGESEVEEEEALVEEGGDGADEDVTEAEPTPEPPQEAPRPPRRRAVIVAHADRDSVIAATLLARDVRLLEGMWVYPQSELMTFFRSVATDLREQTPIYVVGFAASPVRDVLQAVSLYSDRLSWFDHHDWPPEDLDALQQLVGHEAVCVTSGVHSSIPAVLSTCTRRSRFSDKLVDLANARFSEHDYQRWGRLWWSRLGDIASKTGEVRSDLEPLLAGRPSDLAKEAASVETPLPPPEVSYVSSRDFRLVHFGGHSLVVVSVRPDLNVLLCARIARERYGASLSLAYSDGDDLVALAGEETGGRRSFDLSAVAEHMAEKLEWVDSLVGNDYVARFRVRDREKYPERLDDVIGEIAMGRSILER